MQVRVIAVGRLKAGPERELVERYRSRAVAIGRTLGFSGPDLVELPEARDRRGEDRRSDEAARLRDRIGPSLTAILDERAPTLASDAFAERLAALRDSGRPSLSFLVGGPDGFDPSLRDAADWPLSFGRLTLPHQIVRALILEQVYRAFTIIAGHPYHRSGDVEG